MSMYRILSVIAVLVLVLVDFVTGYVKAYLKGELNSPIGLDGLIRKAVILLSMVVLTVLHYLIGFNLIEWLSEGMDLIFMTFNIKRFISFFSSLDEF